MTTCLTCGRPTTGTRCYTCTQALRRAKGSSTQRGYNSQYRAARTAMLANHPLCHWQCGRTATTLDHVPPLVTAPSPDEWQGQLVPACARCNAARGGATRRTES